ncbi:copper-binding protein [Terasakiella sp.]|uniref:copper-binding protein n=1 Tax=Terasakiella sp. TaxID=2034861 RepID=UPI003AA94B96
MKKLLSIALAALSIGFLSTAALADDGHTMKEMKGHEMTKEMKGHEMTMEGIHASGTVNGVKDGKINIAHGKIKELGWPPMKMDFTVAEGVDVSNVKAGQKVDFTLGKGKSGMYEIMGIKMAH